MPYYNLPLFPFLRICVCTLVVMILSSSKIPKEITITPIPTLDQLPVTAIHRIFQDSEGYIWYGTVSGICRDDGYNVVTFRHDFKQKNLSFPSEINSISELPDGNIIFGTEKGLHMIDKSDYSVHEILPEIFSGKTSRIYPTTRSGSIWVRNGNSIYELVAKDKIGRSIENDNGFTSVIEDLKGRIFLTSDSEIFQLGEEGQLYPIKHPYQNRDEIYFSSIDKTGLIWMKSDKHGPLLFNPNASESDKILEQAIPGNKDSVYHLVVDDNGDIWYTCSTTLKHYRLDQSGCYIEVPLPWNSSLPSNIMLNEIIRDQGGNYWVSAFDCQSFIVSEEENYAQYYPMETVSSRFDSNVAVISMAYSEPDAVWFSQERSGLCRYDLTTDRVDYYKDFPSTQNLPLYYIVEMTSSKDGGVWLTPGDVTSELIHISADKELFELDYDQDISHLKKGNITSLHEDESGKLWIGTSNSVLVLPKTRNTPLEVIADGIGHVTCIDESSGGDIWIGTFDGDLLQFIDGRLSKTFHTGKESLTNLSTAPDGDVWFGTEEGSIYRLNPTKANLVDYTHSSGLKGEQVNQIYCDNYGHVWIASNQSIVEFNPANGASFTRHTSEREMPWRLLPTTFTKKKDGSFFVGGIPGVVSFKPSARLDQAGVNAKATITDVQADGHSLMILPDNRERSPGQVWVKPGENKITVSFSSLGQIQKWKLRYAYRLLGIDKNWHYTEPGENTATFERLPAGTYTFQVRTTDDAGLWSQEVTELKIHRIASFHETIWAKILLAMVILGAIVLFFISMRKKNEQLWNESKEMLQMREYISSEHKGENEEEKKLDKALLEKLKDVVLSNLSDPEFNVDTLGKEVGMSKSTLNRKLKLLASTTPLNFIRDIKMEHACKLLADPTLDISDVSEALGFSNRKYFTSCFKAKYGLTPSAYRENATGIQSNDSNEPG